MLRRIVSSFVPLAASAFLWLACSSSGTGGSGDAGPDGAVIDGGYQICRCCGTNVNWPSDQSCSDGACDGLCTDAGKD